MVNFITRNSKCPSNRQLKENIPHSDLKSPMGDFYIIRDRQFISQDDRGNSYSQFPIGKISPIWDMTSSIGNNDIYLEYTPSVVFTFQKMFMILLYLTCNIMDNLKMTF